jgi:hypothetical protein
MNGYQYVADARLATAELPLPSEIGTATASRRASELYARAQAARRQSQLLVARLRAAQRTTAETFQLIDATWDRAGQIRARRSPTGAHRLRYSATARLQARLASMPVIEQAKGIVMAQCGCVEQAAFDVLRQASQRENIKMRDLAARIVAQTVRSASAGRPADPARTHAPAASQVSHAEVVSTMAGAAARRDDRKAAG